MWQEGKRKLWLVYVFGVFGGIVFAFSAKTIAELTALFGFWVALIGWYNQSNIREHQLKNGNGKL